MDLVKSDQPKLHIQVLANTPVREAVEQWLMQQKEGTQRNYRYYVYDLMRRGLIPDVDSNGDTVLVRHFNELPHERAIDFIKTISKWSESSRQVRASCYISFTRYLNRVSQGWFRKAEPDRGTFWMVREQSESKALTLPEFNRFITALQAINPRDALIAKMMLQGAKRISEVLSLTLDQIDYEKNIIYFRQSKTGGTKQEIPISFPERFMKELKAYTQQTGSIHLVFVTSSGKAVFRTQLNTSFERASKAANLPKITPHSLRATWVTIAKQEKMEDSEIMKVTGHKSVRMITYYDKTSRENNCTKKLLLV